MKNLYANPRPYWPSKAKSHLSSPYLWLALAWLMLINPQQTQASSQLLEQGWQALESWQIEDAGAIARQLLCANPQDGPSQAFAAAVLHQQGHFLPSWQLLQQSIQNNSNDTLTHVEARIEGSASYASAFQTLETNHFRLQFLDKDIITATYAGDVLEAAYQAIGSRLGLLPAERGEKISVEIYPNARGLSAATGLTVKQISTTGTIAVCKFHRLMITSPLATLAGYQWADTLAHEFAHLVISKASGDNIPVWLHEGIAKYIETTWRGEAGTALGAYSQTLLKQALRKKRFIPLQKLHPSMALLPSQADAALAFAQVETLVAYLSQTYGIASIAGILQDTKQGLKLEQSLKQRYDKTLPELEQAWQAWLAKQPLQEVAMANPPKITLLEQESNEPETLSAPPANNPNAQKHARLAELLELDGFEQAAAIEYQQALANDGWQDAQVWQDACKAWLKAGNTDKALAILQKGLQAEHDHPDVDSLATRVFLAAKQWSKTLDYAQQAIYQNPYNPDIHKALAQVYAHQQQPDKAAQANQFAELASQPRPAFQPQKPTLPPTDKQAQVYLTTPTWQLIQLGQQSYHPPLFPLILNPGKHTFTWQSNGKAAQQTLTLSSGKSLFVCLQGS